MKAFFLFLAVAWGSNLSAQSGSVVIKGNLGFLKTGDSVILQVYQSPLFNRESDIIKIVKKVHKGSFSLNVPISEPFRYVSLLLPYTGDNKDGSKNLYDFLIEKGDNMRYSTKNPNEFSGKGSKKWLIQKRLSAIDNHFQNGNKGFDGIINQFKAIDSGLVMKLNLLSKHKRDLNNNATKLFIADNFAHSWLLKALILRNSRADKRDIAGVLSNYKDMTAGKYFTAQDSLSVLPGSVSFCEGVIAKYRLDSCFRKNELFSVSRCYTALKRCYSGLLREKLLTTLLYNCRNNPEDISDCLSDAAGLIRVPVLKAVLESLQMAGFKDTEVYKFALSDTSGKKVFLSDFKGKIVLLDFWFTGCSACTQLSGKLRKIEPEIDLKNVVLISINIDKDKNNWIGSVRSGQYTSPHGINLNTGVLGNKHPLITHYLITAYPTLLIFNKEGKRMRNPQDPLADDGKDLISLLN
ncbi:TlpA family protein disulfide reductase [Mucilaginibacter sp. BJC16-A38]|uniref:TlpA family protein disulfide reductase n=1 Tax=Mucilaginibacter phenanthrenivorans TaxID=1234842 RepID=UPI0021584519|nr:TlpA disulfide reductase family protein [Mucilaginibacter phenanthrenivorans]MCR8559038.1 TlpA family protein disulfide reductase [Mucilaginibacter phenanthrenivorans]